MGEHTTEGDGRPDQGVEFFVAADGELEMAGSYALDLEVLGGILWQRVVSIRRQGAGKAAADSLQRVPKPRRSGTPAPR